EGERGRDPRPPEGRLVHGLLPARLRHEPEADPGHGRRRPRGPARGGSAARSPRGLPPAGVDPPRLRVVRRPHLHAEDARLLRPRAALGRGPPAGGHGMNTVAREGWGRVVADSPAMREIRDLVGRLAEARSPVLLEGESGTGKDLVAHWLHYGGARRDGPLIKVHCPSIPEDLLESELFGHERGAFTDAKHAKAGKIELAAGRTPFFPPV